MILTKKAYKKRGYFSGKLGTIELNSVLIPGQLQPITKYILRFENGTATGFHSIEDIVIVSEGEMS